MLEPKINTLRLRATDRLKEPSKLLPGEYSLTKTSTNLYLCVGYSDDSLNILLAKIPKSKKGAKKHEHSLVKMLEAIDEGKTETQANQITITYNITKPIVTSPKRSLTVCELDIHRLFCDKAYKKEQQDYTGLLNFGIF